MERCRCLAFVGGRSRAFMRSIHLLGLPYSSIRAIVSRSGLIYENASRGDYGSNEQHERCGSLVNGGGHSRAFGGGHIYLIWYACNREWSVNANSLECVDAKEQGAASFPQGFKSRAYTWSLVARCRGVISRALGSLVAPSMGVKSKTSGSLVVSSHVWVSS
jgi:hypothetical protein